MKKVFSNYREVLHLWANQSQAEARSGNVFFEGASCYSYGTHYELGRIIDFKGHKIAMINTRGYSPTTAKHISSAHSATSHLIQLECPDGDLGDVRKALLSEQACLVDALFNHFKRLKFWAGVAWGRFGRGSERVELFNEKAVKLGFKELALDINEEFIELYNDHIKRRMELQRIADLPENQTKRSIERAKREAAKEAARIKAEAEAKAKFDRDLEAWLKGGEFFNGLTSIHPQLIRVKDNEVQTSGGASVPLGDAVKLFRAIKHGMASDGTKVGSYEFNRLEDGLIIIGCHEIKLSDAEALLGARSA